MAEIALTVNTEPRKNTRVLVFDIPGRRASITVPKSLFGDNVPTSLILTSDVDLAPVAEPKPKETKEERKARLAALPKKTPAEKLAALEAKAAKLRAKLEAANKPAETAIGETAGQ